MAINTKVHSCKRGHFNFGQSGHYNFGSTLQGFRALAPFMLTVYWPITIEISQVTDDFER